MISVMLDHCNHYHKQSIAYNAHTYIQLILYLTEVEPLCATMRLLQVVPNGTPIQSPSATVLPTSSGLLAQAPPV